MIRFHLIEDNMINYSILWPKIIQHDVLSYNVISLLQFPSCVAGGGAEQLRSRKALGGGGLGVGAAADVGGDPGGVEVELLPAALGAALADGPPPRAAPRHPPKGHGRRPRGAAQGAPARP